MVKLLARDHISQVIVTPRVMHFTPVSRLLATFFRKEPRAKSLANHPDVAVRDFAVETLKEIETFKISEDSYGYVFYVLQRSN